MARAYGDTGAILCSKTKGLKDSCCFDAFLSEPEYHDIANILIQHYDRTL